MMKAEIQKLEDVPETYRGEYKAGEDGKYYLDLEVVDGEVHHPAVRALVKAKRREAEDRGKAELLAKELKERADTLAAERESLLKGTVPKDNVERLENSYKERLANREKELTDKFGAEIARLDGSLREILVDKVAQELAADMADLPIHVPLFLPFVKARLAFETTTEGKATTRVLDKDGKPSAATLEDLKKEILAMPMFSAVALGSKATGGSAPGSTGGGSAPQVPGPNDSPEVWAKWARAKRTGG